MAEIMLAKKKNFLKTHWKDQKNENQAQKLALSRKKWDWLMKLKLHTNHENSPLVKKAANGTLTAQQPHAASVESRTAQVNKKNVATAEKNKRNAAWDKARRKQATAQKNEKNAAWVKAYRKQATAQKKK